MRISDWSSDVCSSDLSPAIIDRHPMLIAISSGGAAPVLARRLRERVEAMLPSGYGRLAAFMHRQRARVKANEDISPRRIWERFIDGSGAEAALRGDAAARSEERRVGKACLSTCRSRGSPSH